ncbi:MAG: hypothetical protein HY268_31215 [Deltaproteobacteria bacterium]|nr:hypothetical protein [Deltaproteobacteria bacterium]
MANIKVAVWNRSTVLCDAVVSAVVPTLQAQVRRDFAPIWGVDADLTFVPKAQRPTTGLWWLVVTDNSDVAGALGYHELTPEGLPLGLVFAATDQRVGLQWTVTASHELIEMLGDPDMNLYGFSQARGNAGTFYAYELCDQCELDEQGYQINGVRVSDFVCPEWFEGFRAPGSTRFDYCNLIERPFQLLPGGYSIVLEVPSGLGWYQISEPAPLGTRTRKEQPPLGGRRERRMRTRDQWRRSKICNSARLA